MLRGQKPTFFLYFRSKNENYHNNDKIIIIMINMSIYNRKTAKKVGKWPEAYFCANFKRRKIMIDNNIYKDALREFEIYFPGIAKDTIGYLPQGRSEILFITKNKDHYIYDMRIRGIRKLKPISEDELTEEEWRAKFSMSLNFKMMGLGFTQRDLAERTGIAYHSICNYVSGKSIPSVYYTEKIAEALGCSIAELTRFQ